MKDKMKATQWVLLMAVSWGKKAVLMEVCLAEKLLADCLDGHLAEHLARKRDFQIVNQTVKWNSSKWESATVDWMAAMKVL